MHIENHAYRQTVDDQLSAEETKVDCPWVCVQYINVLLNVKAEGEFKCKSEYKGESKDAHNNLETVHLFLHGA